RSGTPGSGRPAPASRASPCRTSGRRKSRPRMRECSQALVSSIRGQPGLDDAAEVADQELGVAVGEDADEGALLFAGAEGWRIEISLADAGVLDEGVAEDDGFVRRVLRFRE